MATTSITIRMDEQLMEQAEALFGKIGMDMSTAFTKFAESAVRQQRLPAGVLDDPFYSEKNMAYLRSAIDEIESGSASLVRKTMAELEEMENG